MLPLLLDIPLKEPFITICLTIAGTSIVTSFILAWCGLLLRKVTSLYIILRFFCPICLIFFLILSFQSTQLFQSFLQGLIIAPVLALFWLKPLHALPKNWSSLMITWGSCWWGRVRYFWWPLLKMPALSVLSLACFLAILQ